MKENHTERSLARSFNIIVQFNFVPNKFCTFTGDCRVRTQSQIRKTAAVLIREASPKQYRNKSNRLDNNENISMENLERASEKK